MNALDRVREKFQTSIPRTSKASTSPSAASAGTEHSRLKSYDPPSAVSAGSSNRDLKSSGPEALLLTSERRKAIIVARDASAIHDFRHALVLGEYRVCGNCVHYIYGADPAGEGHCAAFNEGSQPFIPLTCSKFQVGPAPTAPAYLPDPHADLVWAHYESPRTTGPGN